MGTASQGSPTQASSPPAHDVFLYSLEKPKRPRNSSGFFNEIIRSSTQRKYLYFISRDSSIRVWAARSALQKFI